MSVGEAATEKMERRVRCSCGFRTGWFDPGDAGHIAAHHDEECGGDVEYKEREKGGQNHSDNRVREDWLLTVCPECDDGREHECNQCGKRFYLEGPKNNHELTCMGP